MPQYFDIIGDIHGHADALQALLQKLGYAQINGTYQHAEHKVIFLGDFIDRGLQQREVIELVKPMIEQGFALSVIGNHEFNAICYATIGPDGKPLRTRSNKNTEQHQAFLDAYPDESERNQLIEWFKTLPMYIELSEIRVIHASWNNNALDVLSPLLNEQRCLLDEHYATCSDKGSDAYNALETILKGPEVQLPEGVSFNDKDKNPRDQARLKWWHPEHFDVTDRLHLGDDLTNAHKLDQLQIDSDHSYPADHKPLFVGHYWRDGEPAPLSDNQNSACLDYSVAENGKLVAYKWRGEEKLERSRFEW
ncbi:MAG: metallophosphoesterase [Porticoccaceae bacterium]